MASRTEPEKTDEKTVTVLNADPYRRIVDFGVNPETGERKVLDIPAAKTDKFHKTTPGRAEGVLLSTWEAVLKHRTGSKLAKAGTLTLLPEVP